MIGLGIIWPLIPVYAVELGAGGFLVGLIIASFNIARTIFSLMGGANGLSLPGGLVITGQLGRTMGMASLMSVTDAAWSLGMIVSPILSGIILDILGLPFVFVIGSGLILAGGVAVGIFLRDYQPSKDHQK